MGGEKETAILLDIDGVIFPANYDDWPVEINDNTDLERRYLNQYEYYHPKIVDALAEVAMQSTILLSSSRQHGFLTPYYSEIIDKLAIEGALFIDAHRPARIDFKYDAVRRFISGIGDTGLDILEKGRGHILNRSASRMMLAVQRAIWVDDHIPTLGYFGDDEDEAEQREAELLQNERLAIVMPRSRVGLTIAEVEAIRQYLG